MKIGLLGYGNVGRGVAKIIDAGKTPEVRKLAVTRILVRDPSGIADPRVTADAVALLEDPQIDTVVECIGGDEPAYSYARAALLQGKNLVSSNKQMLAAHLGELTKLAHRRQGALRFEAAVGGGIPWLADLERIREIDRVTSFRGIFNGTANYILGRLPSQPFCAALKEAQAAGYAEADPTDDLAGADVRNKVILSAAKAFGILLSPGSIPVSGIAMARREDLAWAAERGLTLKLIGRAEALNGGYRAQVLPVFLKNDDYLSRVRDNFNGLEVTSETLGRSALLGQGAGSLPTGHAVVQDLLAISEGSAKEPEDCVPAAAGAPGVHSYYLRAPKAERFSESAAQAGTGWILTKPLEWAALQEILARINGPERFLAEADR